MRLEEYTADAICRAMSLPGFIEQSWMRAENPTLRVVLTPSFHPELCLTLARGSKGAMFSVVALTEQFWSQRSQVFLPHERETVNLPSTAFDEAEALFRTACSSPDAEDRYVCIDGMGSESCLVSRESTQQWRAHVSANRESGKFVARLIELTWDACRQPRVRNALSQAGYYLSLKYPLQEVTPKQPITRLAVLGTPEERSDYFEMLRQSKKGEPDSWPKW